jgi:ribosomal subunit interface protein
MNIKFTARHFRPHAELKEHALETVKKLDKYYDGILAATVVLSFERTTNSVKRAEISLQVYGGILTATKESEDFIKSIDAASEKVMLQLQKYKNKLRAKNKGKVRKIREKV